MMALPSEPPESALTLRHLLDIEDDDGILAPVCPVTGVAVWSVMRNQFFRLVMSDMLYGKEPLISLDARLPKTRVLDAVIRSAVHNTMHPPQHAQLLVRASGVGLIERQGRSFNRYTDYFVDAAPGGGWSFEDLASWTWPTRPRISNVNFTVASFALIRLRAQRSTGPEHRDQVAKILDRVIVRSAQLVGWKASANQRAWLLSFGARRLATLPYQRKIMFDWIERVRPTVFLAEESCYGPMAGFNAAAREKGVPVAEFQHGAVTGGHDVYNVAPAVRESAAFRKGLPDFFLGYGQWWNEQFNLPVEKLVIGNPHRTARMSGIELEAPSRRRVLVLGDGRELKIHLDLSRKLAEILPASEWEVVFRPHPEERRHVLEMDPTNFGQISIDRESDIYLSLARTEAVIAELSTGLFDAIGLANRIFVWATAKSRFGLPDHPFANVVDAADMCEQLSHPLSGRLSGDQVESIWASGWRERFLSFLSTVGASEA